MWNLVCEKAAIFSRPQCVDKMTSTWSCTRTRHLPFTRLYILLTDTRISLKQWTMFFVRLAKKDLKCLLSIFVIIASFESITRDHDGRHCVSNHVCSGTQRLFRRRSKKISRLLVTGFCEGNPPVTDGFPAQRASNAVNVYIWWCHNFVLLRGPVAETPLQNISNGNVNTIQGSCHLLQRFLACLLMVWYHNMACHSTIQC